MGIQQNQCGWANQLILVEKLVAGSGTGTDVDPDAVQMIQALQHGWLIKNLMFQFPAADAPAGPKIEHNGAVLVVLQDSLQLL